MEWAGREGVCLIPFGGGTSVTRALEVPPLEVEPRPVISVDMRKVQYFFLFCGFLGSVSFSVHGRTFGYFGQKISLRYFALRRGAYRMFLYLGWCKSTGWALS